MNRIQKNLKEAPDHRRRTGRPFVTLGFAQTVDGSIAASPGYPLAISGERSLALAHRLRADHDAILVGIGTVLADDPRLTVRLVNGPDPQPIVVDTRLRLPSHAKLLQNRGRLPWVAAGEAADARRQIELEQIGARILKLPTSPPGWIHLAALLDRLGTLGINSLLVEGGAQIITSFLSGPLVDQVVITIAPRLVGGLRTLGNHWHPDPTRCLRLGNVHYQKLGEDMVLYGEPQWTEA